MMSRSTSSAETAENAFFSGLHGDIETLRQQLASPSLSPAQRAALETVLALATHGELELFKVRAGERSLLLAETCAYHLLAAVLDFNADAVEHLLRSQKELAVDARSTLWMRRGELWLRYLRGDASDLDSAKVFADDSRALGEEAAALKVAAIRIEATALHALAAPSTEEAVANARRATRMARAEGLVHHEYLANVVLARVRRVAGKPHLSTRILAGLAPVVPPVWHRWIEWENAMCGGDASGSPRAASSPSTCDDLRGALMAAQAGDLATVNARFDSILQSVALAAPFQEEALDLRATVDACSPARPSSDWATGRTSGTWDALGTGPDDQTQAFVYVTPQGNARRLIGPAIGLLSKNVVHIKSTQRKDARVMRAAAVLALAGARGLDVQEFFPLVYGFAYETKNDDQLRLLLHRVRALLGEHATLKKSAGEEQAPRLTLQPLQALLVTDPRCARSLEQRVMMLLAATAGGCTPAQAAEELDVSVRQAQRVLKALREQGVCAGGEKRGISYRIEDTTFQEPTRSRIFPAPDQP